MSHSAARSSPLSPDQHGVASSTEKQSPRGLSPLARSATPSHARPLPSAFFGDYVTSFARGGKKKRFHQLPCASENLLDLREIVDGTPSGKRSSRSPMVTPGSLSRSVNSSVRQTPVLRPLRGLEPPTKVLDFLFLGTVYDAQDATFLAQNNIRHIINVSTEEYWSADKRVTVYPFKIMDTVDEDISTIFKDTRNIIERCRQEFFKAKRDVSGRRKSTGTPTSPAPRQPHPPAILVHCQKGRSRSATIVLAYLIHRNGWAVAEALDYVTRLRPVVEPNLGFMDALLRLQESMDQEERNRRCGQQSLCIRNIPMSTSPASVSSFFEDRVGMVRNVVMHGLGATKARASHDTTAPAPTALPLLSPPPGTAPGAATDEAELARSTHVGASSAAHTTAATPPSAVSPAPLHDAAQTPSDPAMCLIMFPCFENVKRAKEYAEAHMDDLERVLGTVPDKEVKLMVPSKLKPTNMSLAGSFTKNTA